MNCQTLAPPPRGGVGALRRRGGGGGGQYLPDCRGSSICFHSGLATEIRGDTHQAEESLARLGFAIVMIAPPPSRGIVIYHTHYTAERCQNSLVLLLWFP